MNNKILIYDDNCPLCRWYSSLFVKFGLLPENGRQPFSSIEPALFEIIDYDRSRNEIPLLDETSRKVFYGVDALLEILGQRSSLFKKVGKSKIIYWLLKKMYRFISYNRKVIVAKKCGNGAIDCSPDLNLKYRIAFMSLCLVFNSILLFSLNNVIFTPIAASVLSLVKLQAAHFGLVASNCILALSLNKKKAVEYLGQISMLATLTILFLIPLMFIRQLLILPSWFSIIYMAATAIVIFKEYLRRMEYAGVLTSNNWIAAINLAGMSGLILFIFL